MQQALTQLEKLVAVQRYEFNLAAKRDQIVFALQIATAVFAVASVALPEGVLSGALAPISLVLIFAAFIFGYRSRVHRALAEKARRASLMVGGLGFAVSDAEILRLVALTGASREDLATWHDHDYFAASGSPGVPRATDMLKESAFWSTHLFQASADRVQWWMLMPLSLNVICFLLALQVFSFAESSLWVKLFSTSASSIASIEFLSRWYLYRIAAKDTDASLTQLDKVRQLGYQLDDFIWAMIEYNSAVESAPLIAPGAYSANEKRLNQLWKDEGH